MSDSSAFRLTFLITDSQIQHAIAKFVASIIINRNNANTKSFRHMCTLAIY